MKIYSEVLRKMFDTTEECEKAELEYSNKLAAEEKRKKELAEQRKTRAKEVEDAYQKIVDAQKEYNKLKNEFIKDYGSFHMSFTSNDNDWNFSLSDFFRVF